eukprot:TRINITY_DN3540_c0_g1_i2.p1 TRINITY_DN3540_c0_g1~~TRINITY_DN3540_c0_g1_i2.p1  ORF type:complete len:496 (-),score=99.47 TRINITY_DN3540_c0_g1_i2:163-1614(-)
MVSITSYAYLWVYIVVQLGLHVYYRVIQTVGKENIPRTGGLIVVANHPNMVMDSLIAASHLNGRLDAHIWAKAPLFKGIMGPILRTLGVVPVRRRQDVTGEMSETDRLNELSLMFKESYTILDDGMVMVIHPEGTSETNARISHFKVGAARLALGYLQQTGKSVPIIPMGLNYTSKVNFRSAVLIKVGQPIYPALAEGEDINVAAEKLTRKVEAAIESCTINANTWEDMLILNTARQIYTAEYDLSLEDNVRIAQKFSQTYKEHRDLPEIIEVVQMVKTYQGHLQDLGLPDQFLSANYKKRLVFTQMIRSSLVIFASLILSFPGLILHSPLWLFGTFVANKGKYAEEIAQKKFGALLVFVPTLYFLVFVGTYFFLGWTSLFVAMVICPLFGWLHIMESMKGRAHYRSLSSLWVLWKTLLFNPAKLDKIRALRTKIGETIDAFARKNFKPEDLLLENRRKKTDNRILRDDPHSVVKVPENLKQD